jgi:hypothetical protein
MTPTEVGENDLRARLRATASGRELDTGVREAGGTLDFLGSPAHELTTEQTDRLLYWSREDPRDCSDSPPLDYVAESTLGAISSPSTRFPRSQLELKIEAWDAPQLSMLARLEVQRTLLDGRTDSNRDAKCMRTRFARDADVPIERFSSGKWAVRGLVTCQRMTCAHCGERKCREAACTIGACIKKHIDTSPSRDVWMLSISPPHHADEKVGAVVARLFEASGHLFRSRAWETFAARYDIAARVRVLDATHGGRNGTHPHFHIALFPRAANVPAGWMPDERKRSDARRRLGTDDVTDAAIARVIRAGVASNTDDGMRAALAAAAFRLVPDVIEVETPLRSLDRADRTVFLDDVARAELLDAWLHACRRAGIEVRDEYAFRRYALQLTPSEEAAAYFVKWGLADEVGASTQKSRSHLRLLDLVSAGHDVAGDLYREWREAVHRKTWITGLADACNAIGVDDDDAQTYLDELQRRRELMLAEAGTPLVKVRELQLVIPSFAFQGALRARFVDEEGIAHSGLDAVTCFVDDIERHGAVDLQAELSSFLWRHVSSRIGPPLHRSG